MLLFLHYIQSTIIRACTPIYPKHSPNLPLTPTVAVLHASDDIHAHVVIQQ